MRFSSNMALSFSSAMLGSIVVWLTAIHITPTKQGLNQYTVYLTLTTLIATLLAIAIAVVVGINWFMIPDFDD